MNDLTTQTEQQLINILKADFILKIGRYNNLPIALHQLVADCLVEMRRREEVETVELNDDRHISDYAEA